MKQDEKEEKNVETSPETATPKEKSLRVSVRRLRINQIGRFLTLRLRDAAMIIVLMSIMTLWQTRDLLPTDGAYHPRPLLLENLATSRFQWLSASLTANKPDHQMPNKPKHSTILYFFAPWCTVCTLNSDTLSLLSNTTSEETYLKAPSLGSKSESKNKQTTSPPRPTVIGIMFDANNPDGSAGNTYARSYAKDKKLNFPIVLASEYVRQEYKITAFPTFYIIDQDGAIVSKSVGYTSYLGLWVRRWLGGIY